MRQLLVNEIADTYVRENFKRIAAEFREQVLLRGKFTFFEIEFPNAVTNQKYAHYLGFMPKDIVTTSVRGGGSLTWNYDLFDAQFLNITTTGACTIRAFIGSYTEGSEA